jgi:poly(A) polymerase
VTIPDNDAEAKLALEVIRRLHSAGHEAWLVGGCVRDLLLDRAPSDYDVATSALPDQVLQLFPHATEVGKSFGVVLVRRQGADVEVATFRADGDYGDCRRPDSVRFTNAREDALRRDFTVNALFMNPETGEVLDEVGGLADLKDRLLRAVGNPEQRFREDSLRLLRAVRLASDLDLEIEAGTLAAIRNLAARISRVSPERIHDEITKGLTRRNPGRYLRLLADTGLMAEVLPECVPMIGCDQPPQFHPEGDVFVHTCLVLDHLPENPSPALAWAALLHDVGKPQCRTVDDSGRIRFNGHAEAGARMVESIAERLHWSNNLRDAVVPIIARHMDWINIRAMRRSTLRRWLAQPTIEDEFALHMADCLGSSGYLDNYEFGRQAQRQMEAEMGAASRLPAPLVSGHDLIALGLRPGPEFARILRQIQDEQLEGVVTNRDQALERLKQLATERGSHD